MAEGKGLAIPYENVQDAQMRLAHSVVLYDGKPVWIDEVRAIGPGEGEKRDIFRVLIRNLPVAKNEQERKFISSRKFDFAPFPMGFMNKGGAAIYCSRVPMRQQRQGLCENTLSTTSVGLQGKVGIDGLNHLVSSKEFAEMIEGKYPTVEEATKNVEDGKMQSCAFHRCFALVKDPDLPELIYLYHKKEKVGFVMDGKLKLSKKGKCLKEQLNEAGVKC